MFISGSVYENSFFQAEMNAVAKAMHIIEQFNSSQIIDRHIYLNQPGIWASEDSDKQKALVELLLISKSLIQTLGGSPLMVPRGCK